ncbi:MAG TPA: hypothetical protein VE911_01695 [Candidatus Nitrosopolaris sp.]|nr:hypothetical protein [Candidatus Nitrosopolaris sp.]
MARGAVTAFMAIVSASPASAMELTACGQFVSAGESAVLATDLACTRTTTFPFSAQGVVLDGGASVDLNGHSITGDDSGIGVSCNPQGRHTLRKPCRVTGPGTVSGFELGIGGIGVVEVTGVVTRENLYGVVVAKCCALHVSDVAADDNDIAGVSAGRLTGSGLHANGNGKVGVAATRFRLARVVASGNGVGGGVYGRGRLSDSVIVGNAGFDGTYDLLAYPRIRTRNSTCGGGIRLRTIFGPGGKEQTRVLGSFACR